MIEIVNDDMPFLVDSVMGELTERGLAVRLVAHPILAVERDKSGKLWRRRRRPATTRRLAARASSTSTSTRVEDEARRAEIVQALEQVLAGRRCVTDWKPMLGRVGEVIGELKANPPPVPVDDIAEAIQFLEWLAADNFTLFGVRDYAFKGRRLNPVKDSVSASCATAKSRCSPAAARP